MFLGKLSTYTMISYCNAICDLKIVTMTWPNWWNFCIVCVLCAEAYPDTWGELSRAEREHTQHSSFIDILLFVPFLVVLCNFACFCQPKIIQKQSTVYQLHLLICWEEADNRLWSIFDLVGGGTKLLPWSKSSWFMSHFWLFYLIHILLGNTSVTCMFAGNLV